MSVNEYQRLAEAYEKCRGVEVHHAIRAIIRSHSIFIGNHNELIKKLSFHSKYSNIAGMLGREERSKLEAEFQEILRLLHNYTAALKSLVDHTRKMAAKILAGKDFDSYQSTINNEFKDDRVTIFLQDLRNCILHCRNPDIGTVVRFGNNSDVSTSIEFSKNDLLKWDGWRSPSRKLLSEYQDGIPLATFVIEYEQKIGSFYEWLISFLKNEYRDELEDLRQKELAIDRYLRDSGFPSRTKSETSSN